MGGHGREMVTVAFLGDPYPLRTFFPLFFYYCLLGRHLIPMKDTRLPRGNTYIYLVRAKARLPSCILPWHSLPPCMRRRKHRVLSDRCAYVKIPITFHSSGFTISGTTTSGFTLSGFALCGFTNTAFTISSFQSADASLSTLHQRPASQSPASYSSFQTLVYLRLH